MHNKTAGFTFICTDTIAASLGVGSVGAVNFQRNALLGTQTEVTIPNSQNWQIFDVYILAAAGAGTSAPQVQFLKNNTDEMVTTPDLSSLLVSNSSRPNFAAMNLGYGPTDILSALLITTIANDATADSITFRTQIAVN